VADVEVAGSEAPPRVVTCPVCGEHFAGVESLDRHLPPVVKGTSCRDPWTVMQPNGSYAYDRTVTSEWPAYVVWSLRKVDPR
jgi:hypothetical protein